MLQLIKYLEKELQETTRIKDNLNVICETSWDLLSPPGSGNQGKFTIEKHVGNNVKPEDFSNSTSKDVYSDVTDLINYGKYIRSVGGIGNTKGNQGHKVSLDTLQAGPGTNLKRNANLKYLEKGPIKTKCSSSSGRSASLGPKRSISNTVADDKNSFKLIEQSVGDRKNPELSKSVISLSGLKNYCHTCSLDLEGKVHLLKMPDELKYMLNQFNCYTNYKLNQSQQTVEKNFVGKFKKLVKKNLQHNLQNSNQYDQYMEYVEISEKARRNRTVYEELPHPIFYRSSLQLELFGAKHHKLLELQLKRKLLNVINDLTNEEYSK